MVKLAGRLTLFAAVAGVGGCDLGSTAIPTPQPSLVVHAVLNPTQGRQFFLVEESLTGAQHAVDSGVYDPGNPIVSGNGIPVTGAVVRLTAPDGLVMTAVETFSSGNRPTGIYVIDLTTTSNALGRRVDIERGGRYHLSVAARGMTVTGTTLVPRGVPPAEIATVAFNRDRDTLRIAIDSVDLARAYWVRVDAPLSAFSLFTVDREVELSGDSRNFFTESLVRVFFPGFLQSLTVAAIDTNLYDYYRTGNDPFSGTGLINKLEGGIGVFGSIVVVDQRQIEVTQDDTGDPIEGEYTRRNNFGTSLPQTLRLYLEARGPTPEVGDRISGSHVRGPATAPRRGAVFGSRKGNTVDLRMLEAQSTGSVDSRFIGTIRGDTLRGSFNNSFITIYVKAGK